MIIRESHQQLIQQLSTIYPVGEADAIAERVLEALTGMNRLDRRAQPERPLTPAHQEKLAGWTTRLLMQEPVQYVLGEAWFCGQKLFVDRNVLIPRPETEELVDWIVRSRQKPNLRILDVGTGSGCIAIALGSQLPGAHVWACDVSEAALEIARKNAANAGIALQFISINFLDRSTHILLPEVDILVSNPPYIPAHQQSEMAANVVNYEPHIALFVPDNDALVFYEALADYALTRLLPGGSVFAEIHEDLAAAVTKLFRQKGFETEIRKDMQGKDRMVCAKRKK